MSRYKRFIALAIVLATTSCMSRCRDKKDGQTTGMSSDTPAGSLILAARQQGAFLPPELADPRYADESTLPMSPFTLPAANFSNATNEVEPNNTEDEATRLSQALAIRGQAGSGDYDHYVFETSGEPQLWAIEAVGNSVGNLLYRGGSSDRTEGQQLDSGRFVIPNLFLAGGTHRIEVRSKSDVSGPYTLRAVPLGKPDLRMEREPNNDDSYAQPLRAGIPRAGLLLNSDDRDFYSFSLREPGHILLQVTGPPEVTLRVTVYRQGNRPSYTFSGRTPGERARMDLMLPTGDYLVNVRAVDKGSVTPYKLRLDYLDPFAPPSDQEPNNEFGDASPLPGDLVLRGSVGEYSDYDWYRLPTVFRETAVRFQVLGMSGNLNPQRSIAVISRKDNRNEYLNWAKTDSIWEMKLPAGPDLYVQLSGEGDYQLRLSFNPGVPPVPGAAPFTVSLPQGPHLVEAFSTLGQTQRLPVTVRNPGSQRVEINLEGTTNHSAWSVSPARRAVAVDAGKEIQVPLDIIIPPDAAAGEAVQIAVRATSAAGRTSATTQVYALCGAIPVNARPYEPLPPQLLGGLNVAWGALGARPVADAPNDAARQKDLFDGFNPNDRGWSGQGRESDSTLTLAVALAGDRASTITGVTLTPSTSGLDQQVDQFDVLVSEDGQSYRQVMSGRLRVAPREQAFVFRQPVRARFAQLRLRSNHGGSGRYYALGEWTVIAAPGEHPFAAAGFNLADPELGGHVVRSQPLFRTSKMVLTPEDDTHAMYLDTTNPNEWVIAFRHNRAAQISRLEWVQPVETGSTRLLTSVDVSISTESPLGPWTPVGTWNITAGSGTTTSFDLKQPAWARFVRFTTTEPQKTAEPWKVAETIRVFERAADASYRSVAAEWGQYAKPAIYERTVAPRSAAAAEEVTGNNKRDDARKVDGGKAYRGRVAVEEDEDWYRIDVPRDHNRIRLRLEGDPMLRAVGSLQDESGRVVASETNTSENGTTQVDAVVEGGKTYFLRLIEPPRSIALVWDNSGSVSPYSPTLYRAMNRFVEAVQPRREFVNLMPFQDGDPQFLLPQWSDQPYALQGAIQNYARQDGSSNAEVSLLAAAEELEAREGSRAILFLTDAASNGYYKAAEAWAALSRAAARVFAVELHLSDQAKEQQEMMRDWADANDGFYSTFRTSEDIDVAFDRTSCMLRRPARYTLIVETRHEDPPAPGGLQVVLAADAVAQNAVEIILDASGSMLQMLGKQRRMDIARTTLSDLVENVLPAGTPFAFRAFGTRMANCESDLLVRLQPLNRAQVGALVRKLKATNLAKTPLGASLRAVAEDLKGVKGQKVVVLLTDGEETCGGDPAAAIQYLKEQGLDVRVNIVGFAVDQKELKSSFERWAELGGGRFFDAKNAQELSNAMTEALRPKFQVTDGTGSVVAEGTADGAPVELPVGVYTVRVLTSPVRTFDRVRIVSQQQKKLEVRAAGDGASR